MKPGIMPGKSKGMAEEKIIFQHNLEELKKIRSDIITSASLGHVNVQIGRRVCSHLYRGIYSV